MENNVKITTLKWTIPMFGNNHYCPYGQVHIKGTLNDGTEVNATFQTKGDRYDSPQPKKQYIIINKQRYLLRNLGTMYYPKLHLEKWEKECFEIPTKNGKKRKRWIYV